jgi:RluA family pseudouridine synthase
VEQAARRRATKGWSRGNPRIAVGTGCGWAQRETLWWTVSGRNAIEKAQRNDIKKDPRNDIEKASEVTSIPRHAEYDDWKLIDYLALLWPQRSQRILTELFAAGRVRSAGRPVGARRKVGELSDLEVHGSLEGLPSIPLPETDDEGKPEVEIPILHEDSRLLVLAKPAGIPVVPDRDKGSGSCLGFLIQRELTARTSKGVADFLRYRVVHRIDRVTSGLVLVAKTPESERILAGHFEHRRIKKEYLAILSGVVEPARFTVACPIATGRKGKMRAQLGGRSALTHFDVKERFDERTLVRARPVTGRTHQIRVHAWAAGHPLVGDPLYGPGGPESILLHSHRYELPQSWEEPRVFECPLPKKLAAAVGKNGEL